MTFEDLPPNWTELPLSTPNLAGDVVDLVLSESLRADNTMLMLPCDDQDIGLPTPIAMEDTDWFADASQRREMVQALAEIGAPSAVIAVSSSRRLPAEVVTTWHNEAHTAFAATSTRLIGFFCAWSGHVNQLPAPR